MAQSGYTPIQLYHSSTASAVPTAGNLADGELAINTNDGVLYYKDSGGVVRTLASKNAAAGTFSSVTITGGSINGTTIGATTASTGAFTTLSASSTVSGTGFSTYLASPPAIGSTTASTGAFTTLSASSTVTLSGGTANGVAYLNGSKVLTTGSALTFDGTNLSSTTLIASGSATSYNLLTLKDTGTTYSNSSWFTAFNNSTNATVGSLYHPEIQSLGIGATSALIFGIGSTPTEQMRLTSTGLGIGTSSPASKLQVVGGDQVIRSLRDTGSGGLSSNDYGGRIAFGTSAGSGTGYIGGMIGILGDATWTAGSSQPSSLAFYTVPSGSTTLAERMRIDSSGNLLVGTTSALISNTQMSVQGSGRASAMALKGDNINTPAGAYVWNSTTTGNGVFFEFGTEATFSSRGSISYNRAGGLTAYNTTSDYRSKDIISSVVNSGEVIDSVPVYIGKMKGATQERPMFIAHETPDYAHTGEKDAVDEDGNPVYQQMDASALIPVMWAEIQSLRKRITTLEAK